jgi:hypothetical protein
MMRGVVIETLIFLVCRCSCVELKERLKMWLEFLCTVLKSVLSVELQPPC